MYQHSLSFWSFDERGHVMSLVSFDCRLLRSCSRSSKTSAADIQLTGSGFWNMAVRQSSKKKNAFGQIRRRLYICCVQSGNSFMYLMYTVFSAPRRKGSNTWELVAVFWWKSKEANSHMLRLLPCFGKEERRRQMRIKSDQLSQFIYPQPDHLNTCRAYLYPL